MRKGELGEGGSDSWEVVQEEVEGILMGQHVPVEEVHGSAEGLLVGEAVAIHWGCLGSGERHRLRGWGLSPQH